MRSLTTENTECYASLPSYNKKSPNAMRLFPPPQEKGPPYVIRHSLP